LSVVLCAKRISNHKLTRYGKPSQKFAVQLCWKSPSVTLIKPVVSISAADVLLNMNYALQSQKKLCGLDP